MDCPEPSNEESKNPTPPKEMVVPQGDTSSWGDVSQLSHPSSSAVPTLTSPLKASDTGVPTTPEGRVIQAINEDQIDQGYDSDGQRPPWEGCEGVIFDGPEEEEEPLPLEAEPSLPEGGIAESFAENTITIEEVLKMKVSELKSELKNRGLDTKGKKPELVSRLKEAIEKGIPIIKNLGLSKAENMAGAHFTPGAHWVTLVCDGDFPEEPQSENLRAPTVPPGEISIVKKRNFSQEFDRMAFSGQTEVPKRWKNGRIAKNSGKWHTQNWLQKWNGLERII